MDVFVPIAGGLLAVVLALIARVDWTTQRIPNALNLALAGGGLGYRIVDNPYLLPRQVAFAGSVFALFLLVRWSHERITGVTGLGLGDVKMAASGALWYSPILFPYALMVSALAAMTVIFAQSAVGMPVSRTLRVPFGPFLGIGIALAFALENFA